MIPPELEALIQRLHHSEKWPLGTIARQLRVHRDAVRRVLERGSRPAARAPRPSIVDPYLGFIQDTLARYPSLPASRLFAMVSERGYAGRPSHFRAVVASLRPRPAAEAYLRLRTLPGEQAQVDWAHFGRLQVGRASRPLVAFVYVLSYSRALYLRFFLSQALESFLRGHQEAFAFLGGCARVHLYDNLRSVVLERAGAAIRFHRDFLAFAGHCRFEPRPVAVARGNEKGRVERAVQFARSSFFCARRFQDLDDLNRQAREWCGREALQRRWPDDHTLSVQEAFLQEQPKLGPLPADPFPTAERVEVAVGKSPYIRFDLNDYSVPHDRTRRSLTVLAEETTLRIFDGPQCVAAHRRSFSRGEQIEDPAHVAALVEEKRAAGRHRGVHRILGSAPGAEALLASLAERGEPLGRALRELEALLGLYGPDAFQTAVKEALRRGAPHVRAVQHILEAERARAGEPPPVPRSLFDDPRLRRLRSLPHDLASYDQIRMPPDPPKPSDTKDPQ